MTPLPKVMVAPNGATKTKADHAALPVTIPEIVTCARDCFAAGADGLHAHVRDSEGRHVLDAGLYSELLAELAWQVPAMLVQITTEAVGRYQPEAQRKLVDVLRPRMVSIALREITAEPNMAVTGKFFAFCAEAEVAVQHILYDSTDVALLGALVADGTLPKAGLQVLHVLGRYAAGQISSPEDIHAPLAAQAVAGLTPDWAVCAFGPSETNCLRAAVAQGGKARIGFENNLIMRDGRPALNNAERVAELLQAL